MHGGDIYRNDIELDFSVNVNPFGIPDLVKEALTDGLKQVCQYPDMQCSQLKKELAIHLSFVQEEQIICGNGASELLMGICRAIMPKKALIVAPGFSGYEYALSAVGAKIEYCYLRKQDGYACTLDFIECMKQQKPDVVILAHPSNPVGRLLTEEVFEAVLSCAKGMGCYLIIDECFINLTLHGKQDTKLSYIKDYEKFMILRAFTKSFAMPGIRLGYLIGKNETLLSNIEKQLPEWNVSVFAQLAGIAALKENVFLEKSVKEIEIERNWVIEELLKLGIEVFSSDANFLLFYDPKVDWYQKLLQEKILIRDCSDYEGLSKGYYRIAIKSHAENKQLIQLLKQRGF